MKKKNSPEDPEHILPVTIRLNYEALQRVAKEHGILPNEEHIEKMIWDYMNNIEDNMRALPNV